MKQKIFYTLLYLNFSLLSFGQFEEQFLKAHRSDSVKNIKVWYFNNATKIDFVKHQGYRFYTFNRRGNNMTRSCFNDKNILLWKSDYFYDSLNRVIKEISYNREFGRDTIEVVYNHNEGIMEYQSGLSTNSETNQIKYDADSNMTEVISFSNDRETNRNIYKYTKFDQKGNWIEMIWYMQGNPFRTFIRKLSYYKSN